MTRIEAEVKARLDHPDTVRAALAERAQEERSQYADTYFDDRNGTVEASDRELRIRVKTTENGESTTIFTYKEAAVDAETGSKPEHETLLSNGDAMRDTLAGLGYTPIVSLTKNCQNYQFDYEDLTVLATIVTVPQIHGTFLEVESLVEKAQVAGALHTLRRLLTDLGIAPANLTTELYTDAVRGAQTDAR
jgi:adenylate cyclase, class 2